MAATLDDYVVGRQIGKGTYGSIYYVTRKSDDQNFALKVIYTDEAGLASLQEGDILFRLHHPNVSHGVAWLFEDPSNQLNFQTPINTMFILELATANLTDFIAEHADLSLTTRIRFCYECATAVKALQDGGVHHLDIKPENILVYETENQNYITRLADFGQLCYGSPSGCYTDRIAFSPYQRPPEETYIGSTVTLSQLGIRPEAKRPPKVAGQLTKLYPTLHEFKLEAKTKVSPYHQYRNYTAKSNIWALAHVFYYVLTGRGLVTGVYYQGVDDTDVELHVLQELLENILVDSPKRTQIYGYLPSQAAIDLIASMLAYQPDDRPTIETVLANSFFTSAGYTQTVPGLTFETKAVTFSTKEYGRAAIDFIRTLTMKRTPDQVAVFFLAVDIFYRTIASLISKYQHGEIIAATTLTAVNMFDKVAANAFGYPAERLVVIQKDIVQTLGGALYQPNIYTEAWSAWSLQQLAPLVYSTRNYTWTPITTLASRLALLEPPQEKENRQSKDIRIAELTLQPSPILTQLLASIP